MSHIKMSALKVAQACEAFIYQRKLRIAQEQEKLISEEMTVKRFVFFGRTKTRLEAIKTLKTHGFAYTSIAFLGGNQACRVNDLLRLATLSCDGEVFVSAEDASDLASYF